MKKCSKCGEVKELEEFGRTKFVKSGRRSWCKECEKIAKAKRIERYVALREQGLELPEEKTCSGCEEVKPLEEFSKKKENRDGRGAQCKKCVQIHQAERAERYETLREEGTLELPGEKRCSMCEEVKPLEEFNRNKARKCGRSTWCRKCSKSYKESRRKENRNSDLVRNYGITIEQYEAMLEAQGGACEFCGKTPEANGMSLSVDHDHETGEVRWLLCNGCNMALGSFSENVAAMRKAADMLEKWQNL